MKAKRYLVATIKSWNKRAFEQCVKSLPGEWHLIDSPQELTQAYLEKLNPRYIFFPHWSWIVPEEIVNDWECVCFHMADVPYGRGGSPLQNLIVRGVKKTKLTALRMCQELDAGPVYGKLDLSLEGSAQEIFETMAPLVYKLAEMIIEKEPIPLPQSGDAVCFRRRTAEQSLIPDNLDLSEMYDYIRMLDAEGYPSAFIQYGNFKIEFGGATGISKGELEARVKITKI